MNSLAVCRCTTMPRDRAPNVHGVARENLSHVIRRMDELAAPYCTVQSGAPEALDVALGCCVRVRVVDNELLRQVLALTLTSAAVPAAFRTVLRPPLYRRASCTPPHDGRFRLKGGGI